jgi:hypothetical protein
VYANGRTEVDMVRCPNSKSSSRRHTFTAAGAAAAFVVIFATTQPPLATAADPLADWLTRASDPISNIHRAEDQAMTALRSNKPLDLEKLKGACTQLSDANGALQKVMPTPDPNLTAEVQQAVDNFETAADVCPKIKAKKDDNQQEFMKSLYDAEQHLAKADAILVKLSSRG